MLLVLCLGVLADVARRFLSDAEPVSNIMIAMSVVSMIVSVLSLRLLRPLRNAGVNLRAACTFSINDLVANTGVLAAGLLVAGSGRSWPDLAVGFVIALIAAKGGLEILLDVRRTARVQPDP